MSGWWEFGPNSITNTSAAVHSGTQSALVANRTDWPHGIAQTIFGTFQPDATYRISAWVKLAAGAGSQPVQLTVAKGDSSGTTYTPVAEVWATSTNWTQLVGGYTLRVTGTLWGLSLAMQGPSAGVSFYADDFLVENYDWKSAANARIEQMRKRDVRLQIVDASGKPVPATSVQVNQTRHTFGFGSAINFHITNSTYAAFFRTNFEWAVIEDETKWYINEPTRSNVTYTVADGIAEYCRTNGITMRGHCIFWAPDGWVQPWLKDLPIDEARAHLSNRVEGVVGRYKGTFKHWDVNNEMLAGNYYESRFGHGINAWMFKHAQAQDSEVKLFANEFNVIDGNWTDSYKQEVVDLIASNAPVSGLGVQAHFFSNRPSPAYLEIKLDSLAELGLPIWISEFDSIAEDENVRADTLETLYRTAFSKPAVDGIMMWGFWAGAKWLGSNAAIVNLDWTMNAAGHRYRSLIAEWTTVTNGMAGGDGAFGFRGFHGSYDITITPPAGLPTLRRIVLDPGAGTNLVTLIAHSSGARPLLHHAGRTSTNGPFQFQLTGDAGRSYAIEVSADARAWGALTNLPNPDGTIWFTNPVPVLQSRQFFRARLLP